MGIMDPERGPFLAWQWSRYPQTHRDHANLLVHATTAPLFLAGTVGILASPVVSLWLLPAGLLGMGLAMALQGRTHRREAVPPAPFRGPGDFVLRLLAEQWVTFPRYVLTGSFARAWRESRP
jgi:hypothetical protein